MAGPGGVIEDALSDIVALTFQSELESGADFAGLVPDVSGLSAVLARAADNRPASWR